MKERSCMHIDLTRYGFEFGSAKVERLYSDDKKGFVVVSVTTPKHGTGKELQIYVTKTGKIRVFCAGIEWKSVESKTTFDS